MLRYLRRFIGQAVVSRYNIIPRQLAKSQKTKPGSKHRIVIQRLRLILKGRDLVIYLIHENQPCLIMLRSLIGQTIAALLRQGFFGSIL